MSISEDKMRQYYDQIRAQDIMQVARDLVPDRITLDAGATMYIDCPHHTSSGHRSFQITAATQYWYCHGCGKGGDVLHLIEFLRHGVVTHTATRTHVDARDLAAQRVGLGPMGKLGATKEQREAAEKAREQADKVFSVLTTAARFWSERLMKNPEMLAWLRRKWPLNDDIIRQQCIGYADEPGELLRLLRKQGHSDQTLVESALFYEAAREGGLNMVPFYKKRIVFPYWERGQVVYMIGRRTPNVNQKSDYEKQKYIKLPVYNPEGNHAHLSPHITNRMFNLDVLRRTPVPKCAIITEGIADANTLMQHGFPVISPVTVRFKQLDLSSLVNTLRAMPVYIVNDNEPSCAGLQGALDTARDLRGYGIEAKVATLPLFESQTAARTALRDTFGLEGDITPDEKKRALEGRTDAERAECERLEGLAKQDVASYFLGGGAPEGFADLLPEARTPFEWALDRAIPKAKNIDELAKALKTLLLEVMDMDKIRQNGALDRLLASCKTYHKEAGITKKGLLEQLAVLVKKRQSGPEPIHKTAMDAVNYAIMVGSGGKGRGDYVAGATAWFKWLTEHGAQFFKTPNKEPYMFVGSKCYWLDSGSKGHKQEWAAFVMEEVGILNTTQEGRTFFEAIKNLVFRAGTEKAQFTWVYTDKKKHCVYFGLNNSRDEIVRISPTGVKVMPNGQNEDGVLLAHSEKMLPIEYDPEQHEIDATRTREYLHSVFTQYLTCDANSADTILAWVCSILLQQFAETRPMTRFEGPAGSGKTTASKFMGTFIYGQPVQMTATNAALFADGAKNPLQILDNLETPQLQDDALVNYLLTAVTGNQKEKRKAGTESDNTKERTNCIINSTGIEPMGAKVELLTRTFTFNFAMPQHITGVSFIQSEIIDNILDQRPIIMAYLFHITSRVLAAMHEHRAQGKMMGAIQLALPGHDKERGDDYTALMALVRLAIDNELESWLANPVLLPPFVTLWLDAMGKTSETLAVGSNPIAIATRMLAEEFHNAYTLDRREPRRGMSSREAEFVSVYGIELCRDGDAVSTVKPVPPTRILSALQRISRKQGVVFPYSSPETLGRRIKGDQKVLDAAGIIFDEDSRPNRGASRMLRVPDMFTDLNDSAPRNSKWEDGEIAFK